MNILVTGAAGFIGYHLCELLVLQGHTVVGIDNINDYYRTDLKYGRLLQLGIPKNSALNFGDRVVSTKHEEKIHFVRMNLEDRIELPKLFQEFEFEVVVNLAAQAGVRYSLENPAAYVDSNISGFVNILECCRHHPIAKLLYASSSSVYGNSDAVPFKETANVDNPISLYAATKKANELMAHTYSHLFNIETIGLRFFTVYGPWGRPDMAMFLFTDAVLNDKPIKVFNHGNLSRDFTYIDDIISGISGLIEKQRLDDKLFKLFNIGNSNPVQLLDFIEAIEFSTGKTVQKEMLPMQPGDVHKTWADTTELSNYTGYKPTTTVNEGVDLFVKWYKNFYNC